MSETPEEQEDQTTAAMIAAVVALLLAGASIVATAKSIGKFLKIPFKAVMGVMAIMRATPPAPPPAGVRVPLTRHQLNLPTVNQTSAKTPTQIISDANNTYRSAFLINSSRRVHEAGENGDQQLAKERGYWNAHIAASNRRMIMAARVEEESKKGPKNALLGWYATLDERTSPECRAADGRNFYPTKPPVIGYPGSVHLYCRCVPGPAHPGGKMVDASTTVQNSDEASGFEQEQGDG